MWGAFELAILFLPIVSGMRSIGFSRIIEMSFFHCSFILNFYTWRFAIAFEKCLSIVEVEVIFSIMKTFYFAYTAYFRITISFKQIKIWVVCQLLNRHYFSINYTLYFKMLNTRLVQKKSDRVLKISDRFRKIFPKLRFCVIRNFSLVEKSLENSFWKLYYNAFFEKKIELADWIHSSKIVKMSYFSIIFTKNNSFFWSFGLYWRHIRKITSLTL